MSFIDAVPVDLRTILPNLPPLADDASHPSEPAHLPPAQLSRSALDLFHRFLVYPPERRLKASDALHHPWLASEPLLLPPGYPSSASNIITEWNSMSLGAIIHAYIDPAQPHRRASSEE